jgi:hypothetical protein
MEGLRETTKHLIQNSRYLGRDLNLEPAEYEAGISVTERFIFILLKSKEERLILRGNEM